MNNTKLNYCQYCHNAFSADDMNTIDIMKYNGEHHTLEVCDECKYSHDNVAKIEISLVHALNINMVASNEPDQKVIKTQVMIDLETLGTKPGSVLLAIGAVKFGNGEILSEFYERIDAESCVKLGFKIDISTVMWWLKQADEPRLEITKLGKPLSEVLISFSEWIGADDVEVWGNGAAFDNVLLSCAYDATTLKRPWKYSGDRCYRTVKNLYPEVKMVRDGTHHNALDDARDQALHLMTILNSNKNANIKKNKTHLKIRLLIRISNLSLVIG